VNTTNTCFTAASFTVYDIPAIITSINPPTISQNSQVTLTGKHFLNCGKATVRLQSTTRIKDYPALFNNSAGTVQEASVVVFHAEASFSGTVSLSLDGVHFDSLSIYPITLTVTKPGGDSSSSDDSDSVSPNPDGPQHAPSLVWLYVVLGIVGTAAGAFLIFVIYKYKVKDDYSRLYDL